LALKRHFDNLISQMKVTKNTELYDIKAAYNNGPIDWIANLRQERFFDDYLTSPTIDLCPQLYRPDIVDKIISKIDRYIEARLGIFVLGPQGIGKSSSLVNTVIKLESTGDYLVTFIPDCDKWNSALDLVKAIAASFGATPDQIPEMKENCSGADAADNLDFLIDAISSCLAELKPAKKWVFVFDHINKVFTTNVHPIKSISGLQFPYYTIKHAMQQGRVISVISASANNKAAESGQHDQFILYNHPINMTAKEIPIAFKRLSAKNAAKIPMHNKCTDRRRSLVCCIVSFCL
jgi:Cdc6-like AAA superfamily ATPase